MLAPYRIAATARPAEPDDADAYEAQLRARTSRRRRLVVGLLGAIAASSVVALVEAPPRRQPREPAEARALRRLADARVTIAASRELIAREQARFARAMGAALDAKVEPDASDPPCSVSVPAVRPAPGGRAFPLLVVAAGDRDLPSPSLASMATDVNRADELLTAGRTTEALVYTNALSSRTAFPRLRYDVVLVTTSMRHPRRTTPTSFEPGEITGRAYLYDFGQHRVTCVGDVHVTSSTRIEYSYVATSPWASMDEGPRLTASLNEDLDAHLQNAIAGGVLREIARL